MRLSHFILGLLAQHPMSGYDIKCYLKGLDWLIDSPSGGSLYPVLRTLWQENLVALEVVPGLDKPPRKVYSITESGHRALQAWIEHPSSAKASLRAFVMRLLLADSHSHARLTAQLQQRQSQVAAHYAELVADCGSPGARPNLGQGLALDYSLTLGAAELAWLDATLDRLERQQLPREEIHSDGGASAI